MLSSKRESRSMWFVASHRDRVAAPHSTPYPVRTCSFVFLISEPSERMLKGISVLPVQ